MTCIAWDGKTLAADKLMVNGATRGTTTKIFRHAGELLGVTGNLSIGMEMLAWLKDGADPDKYPASNRLLTEGCSLIRVRADGSVLKYESSPFPFVVEGSHCAFGSGEESAMAAMHCGADAFRAVSVACMCNTGCGNGIDTLTLG